jgi:molybdate transport system permease protein
MDWDAVIVTLKLAFATTVSLLVIGLPIGYWTATTRRRLLRMIVEASVAIPILLPPTVIGFYLLQASGPHTFSGRWVTRLFGAPLPFSFAGIVVGSVIYNLPFAVRPFTAAFGSVDRRLIEASWCLGRSKLSTFIRIIFPLSWAGVLTGIVLSFAHTVGEFGVVLMLGGDIEHKTRTISISIFDDVQAMNYAAAGRTSLALVAFAFVVLCATYGMQRRVVAI